MKVYFTLLALAVGSALVAQDTLPNASFERWSTPSTYDVPDLWFSTNDLIGNFTVTVAKSTDAVDGTYSCRLSNGNILGNTVPGVVSTGSGTIAPPNYTPTFSGGAAFSERPDQFLGKYNYTPATGDTGMITIGFTVYDTAQQMSVPVGGAYMDLAAATSGWEDFSLPIIYTDPRDPDTVLVVIACSRVGPTAPAGTVLLVDSLGFPPDSTSGITVPMVPAVMIYPNPTSEMLTVELDQHLTDATHLCIYDITGALVDMRYLDEALVQVDVRSYSTGLYAYTVGSSSGRAFASGRFAVVR
jgi:hypothetical protein